MRIPHSRSSSRLLSVAVHVDFSSEFGRQIMRGVAAFCRAGNRWRAQRLLRRDEIRNSSYRCADAYVVQVTFKDVLTDFQKLGRPVVNVSGRMGSLEVPSVRNDDREIGRMAARHFLVRGFKRFAYVGIPDHPYSDWRCEGYCEAVAAAGFEVEVIERVSDEKMAGFFRAVQGPVALLCANDQLANRMGDLCLRVGRAIPEDIAILGVDNDYVFNETGAVLLSSIELAGDKVGYEAARYAERLFDDPGARLDDFLVPPVQVHARRSTDLVAVDDPHVADMLTVMREHYHEPTTIGDLVREIPLNRRTLEMRFKAATGRTLRGELVRIRLEQAKTLLADTDLSIERVAEAVGMKESRHLSAAFRKHFGFTPSQWRRRFAKD